MATSANTPTSLTFFSPRKPLFVAALGRWGISPSEKATFLVMELDHNVVLTSRNVGTTKMLTPRTLNLFDVLNADKLVLTRDALHYLNSRDDDDDDEQVNFGNIREID